MSIISVNNLKKYYLKNTIKAVDGISFTVEKGERFGFLGPNGAGKTTTIRSLLGMLQITDGEISFMEKIVNPLKDVQYRNQIGYLPGELGIYKDMNTYELLRYLSSLYNSETNWDYIEILAKRFQLNMERPMGDLSKGNKQKVGIIAALMHKFPLLILDEPTSGLDPIMQSEFYKVLRELQIETQCTIFISSHLLNEVENFCDRVAIIKDGKIVEVTTIKELHSKNMKQFSLEFENLDSLNDFISYIKTNYPNVNFQDEYDLKLKILVPIEKYREILGRINDREFAGVLIRDINVKASSLEQIFMTFYKSENEEDEIENE